MRVDRFGRPIPTVPPNVGPIGNQSRRMFDVDGGIVQSPIYPSYPRPIPAGNLGPPPSFQHDMKNVSKLMELEKEAWKDEEVVVPLNHWENRQRISNSGGLGPTTFLTPIFDFWYDHLVEEGMPSGQVVSSAGGVNPAPGTSPTLAYQWQNHIYDYTIKLIGIGGTTFTVSAATITVQGCMSLQALDEPFTISTLTITNDLAKPDTTAYISGRTPMRMLRFSGSVTFSAISGGANDNAIDLIHQIAARPT